MKVIGNARSEDGHKGLTRPYVKPYKEAEVAADRCPACGTKLGSPLLGSPFRIESKTAHFYHSPRRVEPANNKAERALREHVVQRKTVGTLRNNKGTSIHERT